MNKVQRSEIPYTTMVGRMPLFISHIGEKFIVSRWSSGKPGKWVVANTGLSDRHVVRIRILQCVQQDVASKDFQDMSVSTDCCFYFSNWDHPGIWAISCKLLKGLSGL